MIDIHWDVEVCKGATGRNERLLARSSAGQTGGRKGLRQNKCGISGVSRHFIGCPVVLERTPKEVTVACRKCISNVQCLDHAVTAQRESPCHAKKGPFVLGWRRDTPYDAGVS